MFTLILQNLPIWRWQRECHASTLYMEFLREKPSNTWPLASTTPFRFYCQTDNARKHLIYFSVSKMVVQQMCLSEHEKMLSHCNPLPSLPLQLTKTNPKEEKIITRNERGIPWIPHELLACTEAWANTLISRVSAAVTVEERQEFPLSIPPFPTEKREGGRQFPTPPIGLYSEGGAGRVTDKQQRRKRGATVGLQHARSHKYSAGFISVWGQIKCS